MVEIVITDKIQSVVYSWVNLHFPKDRQNHKAGDLGNDDRDIVGYFGEAILCVYLNIDVAAHFTRKPKRDPGWDFELRSGKYDCKALTRMCCRPLPAWKQNVLERQIVSFNPDGYIFCDIWKDYSRGFIDGWLPKKEFLRLAVFHHAGDDSGNPAMGKYKQDGRDIPISLLRSPLDLIL